MHTELLKKLGFTDKSVVVYLTLLQRGPSSVRDIADTTQINRGSVYDTLKWLQEEDLVTYYRAETKQQFVAEHPQKLVDLLVLRQSDLGRTEKELRRAIPELTALRNSGAERPIARYYDQSELRAILEDVLTTCSEVGESLYRIYSAAGIREYLYDQFPSYSDARIAKGIRVQVIALGEGGETRGLDERKWLGGTPVTPTYIIIYPGKTAYISLDQHRAPIGVVIENEGIANTQSIIFDTIWNTL
jgi:sugar-specific transcriptional regulator TrmB